MFIYVVVIIICVLCVLLFLKSKIGVVTTNDSSDFENIEDELISIPDEKAYYDETNIAIIELKKKIDEFGISKEDTIEIKKLKKQITNGFEEWGKVTSDLDRLIEERLSFVNTSTFYPRTFNYDINHMKIKRESAREFQLENPMRPTDDFIEYIEAEKNKVTHFSELKSKIDTLLPSLETYESTLKTKKDQVHYFSMKQKMFIAVQEGNIKEAKQLFSRLRAKTK